MARMNDIRLSPAAAAAERCISPSPRRVGGEAVELPGSDSCLLLLLMKSVRFNFP